MWDVETKKVIQQYKEHSGVIHQVKFHSLGNIAGSCSQDKKIKLYDLRAREVIQVYEQKHPIKSFDFHPHTSHIICASDDGETRIFNTEKGALEYTLSDTPSNLIRFSEEGDYFITGGSDKTISLWKSGFFDSFREKLPVN